MGAAGNVIVFVCTLAFVAGLTAFVLAYAAHCYFVVVQDTSAGLDRVKWPSEPLIDWLRGAAHLGGLVLIWLAPAGILSRALRHDWLPDAPALRFLLLAVPGTWLLFPPGLLASFGGRSRTASFRPGVVLELLRILPHAAVFYLFTGLLLAASAALWHRALFTRAFYLLPLAGALGAAVVLIHARLLGRVAWLLQQIEGKKAPRVAAPDAPVPKKRRAKKVRAVEVQDPWAVPKKKAREPDVPKLPVEGYGLGAAWGGEKPLPRPKTKEQPAEEGYEVVEEPAGAEARPAPLPESTVPAEAVARELEMRERAPAGPPPNWPLFSGAYSFPFYDTSLGAWLALALGGTAVGAGLRMLMAFWPF